MEHCSVPYNKSDRFLTVFIGSLIFGAVGGSLQVIRLISLCMLPFNIYHILTKRDSKSVTAYLAFGIFWVLYSMLSLSWTPDENSVKIGIFYLLIHFNIVYTIIRYGRNAAHPVKSLVFGWIAFIALSFPIALYELTTGNHFYTVSRAMELEDAGVALNGVMNKKYAALTFNNYNEYMTALSFGLPYLMAALLLFKKKNRQLFLWGIVAIYFVVIMLTTSRGAILNFVLCMVIFLYYYHRISFPAKKAVAVAVVLFTSVGLLVSGNMVLDQLNQRLDANAELMTDIGRTKIYMEAFQIVRDSRYFGVGSFGFLSTLGFEPHNLFLELLGEHGLIVFAGVLCILLSTIIKSYKFSRENTAYRAITMMVFCPLPVVSVINSGYLTYPFLWVATGSILLLKELYQKNTTIYIHSMI